MVKWPICYINKHRFNISVASLQLQPGEWRLEHSAHQQRPCAKIRSLTCRLPGKHRYCPGQFGTTFAELICSSFMVVCIMFSKNIQENELFTGWDLHVWRETGRRPGERDWRAVGVQRAKSDVAKEKPCGGPACPDSDLRCGGSFGTLHPARRGQRDYAGHIWLLPHLQLHQQCSGVQPEWVSQHNSIYVELYRPLMTLKRERLSNEF